MSEMLYSRYAAFTPLQLNALKKEDESLIILDTRTAGTFTTGFIPGAIFIGHEGSFTEWCINLLPVDKKMIVVTPAGKEEMHIDSLVNAGFTNVAGYLEDGLEAWKKLRTPY
ncbi:MAG TPA: rhodanese-like domain-containing protein [Agriterribacter sp.]|nr:rhodanese-like domain-containing protein [Agriterribacter sp.]